MGNAVLFTICLVLSAKLTREMPTCELSRPHLLLLSPMCTQSIEELLAEAVTSYCAIGYRTGNSVQVCLRDGDAAAKSAKGEADASGRHGLSRGSATCERSH